MKCPKCGYTSFPYVGSCGKCGRPLAGARELYGVYALPPNPPDLTLAAELVQSESTDRVPREPLSSPTIDLNQLNDIDLALASPDADTPDAVADQTPLEVADLPLQLVFDVSGGADLTLEFDDVSAALPPSMALDKPLTTTDEVPVFELDLGDEDESLILRPVEEGSSANEDDTSADTEYILEIEEELELEVEELTLEDDPDDEATDGDKGHDER
jgi:hypothetical protein